MPDVGDFSWTANKSPQLQEPPVTAVITGKMEKSVFKVHKNAYYMNNIKKIRKIYILLLTDEQVCFIIETIQGNQGAKNFLTQHHSIGNNKIHHMQI